MNSPVSIYPFGLPLTTTSCHQQHQHYANFFAPLGPDLSFTSWMSPASSGHFQVIVDGC
jgi:hypothetical protein